jgi:hypothetical protein
MDILKKRNIVENRKLEKKIVGNEFGFGGFLLG